MAITPITPNDAKKLVSEGANIPDNIIDTFNQMIVTNCTVLSNGYVIAKLYQDDIISQLESLGYNRNDIFNCNLLNVEPIFRKAGWKVTYDKPGYNESYKASFLFCHGA